MKKALVLIVTLLMVASILVGCGRIRVDETSMPYNPVPNIMGLVYSDAKYVLEIAGFRVTEIEVDASSILPNSAYDRSVKKGEVFKVSDEVNPRYVDNEIKQMSRDGNVFIYYAKEDYLTDDVTPTASPTPPSPMTSPPGDIPIDATHFPDANFRAFLQNEVNQMDGNGVEYGWDGERDCIDENRDGVLSAAERAEITKIDVRKLGITSLQGIAYFPALTHLYCMDNRIEWLDVSNNTKLIVINCRGNRLNALDLSENKVLSQLWCYDNPNIRILDLRNNKSLVTLRCSNTGLSSLDVSQNPELVRLVCADNELTSLDVSNNKKLHLIEVYGNYLQSLKLWSGYADHVENLLIQNTQKYWCNDSVKQTFLSVGGDQWPFSISGCAIPWDWYDRLLINIEP
ncbi:MAG: hypothetical protein FWF10_01100 [Clostridiales bacterium]|nr:hypothetical protein [Clostridiales bacterium]